MPIDTSMLPFGKGQRHKRLKERHNDKAFLIWLRDLSCCMAGTHGIRCYGDVVGAHYRKGGKAGIGCKPPFRAVPLCFGHHDRQHRIGEPAFYGPFNPEWLIKRLRFAYLVRSQRIAVRAIRKWETAFIGGGVR